MAGWKSGASFIAGQWKEGDEKAEVRNPWNNEKIASVSQAGKEELEQATTAAVRAAADFRNLPRHYKSHICKQVADGISTRFDEFAELITRESGKPIQYARAEAARAVTTFTLAAHEALRFAGENLPLDISAASEKYRGYSNRLPPGPVAAISPFNFPLNLVAHKIAPALAVGAPVVLKPAPQTPLTALLLAEVIEAADVMPGAVSIIPMPNEVAEQMVRDERFAIFTFTGSATVGWHLKSIAGRKRVLLELGGNAPAIVHCDADISHAVDRLIPGSFAASGQVCIKAQRLMVHEEVYEQFKKCFLTAAHEIASGDPMKEETVVGPLIDETAAIRVQEWIKEATDAGAKLLWGGERDGSNVTPTVLENTPIGVKCITEEIFGPVVTLESYGPIDEAISRANSTRYGLQASLFTYDTRVVERAARDLQYGGVIINDSPMVRVDNYPYGGAKDSGLGREGVRYAMEEYTEPKVVVTRSMI